MTPTPTATFGQVLGRTFSVSTGLSDQFDRRLGEQMDRAFRRMGEATHERWIDLSLGFEAQGFAEDVACAKALDIVTPGWRRFRK